MKNNYLEYYGEHNISPVKQNISDINLHFSKREKLYRQLGIPTIAFRNSRILEIGPGGGYNTLAFFQWGEGIIELVEPNKAGLDDMKKLFEQHNVEPDRYIVHKCVIEDFIPEYKYDIVIAEGFIHAVDNSKEIIAKLEEMTNNGGVIVITCMDEVSVFVEQMKRLVCHIITKDIQIYDEKVSVCAEFFKPQLSKLNGMSRSIEDWVKDNMLNPAFNNHKLLSIGQAISYFSEGFELLGTSQNMFTDYSWYKDIDFDVKSDCIQQFKLKQHNLLMTGLMETVLTVEENTFLVETVIEIRSNAILYEITYDSNLIECNIILLKKLLHIMKKIDGTVFGFTKEIIEILETIEKEKLDFSKFHIFYTAMGRGQQYLSMVKRMI